MSKYHYENYDNLEVKVIDNFLNITDFIKINENLLGNNFSWYYNEYVVNNLEDDSLDSYQFIHNFMNHPTHIDKNKVVQNKDCISDKLYLINPILKRIKAIEKIDCGEYNYYDKLLRAKANLQARTEVRRDMGFHCDFQDQDIKYMTAIYYVNSNDGKTVFEDMGEVESVKNRLVLFPGYLRHQGTTCTDEKVRCVINFDFLLTDD